MSGAEGRGLALLSSGAVGQRRLLRRADIAPDALDRRGRPVVVGAWSDPSGWLPRALLAGAGGALGLIAF